MTEYKKEYREKNAETIKEYQQEYREANKEKHKEYYEANKEKYKEYYEKNKEKLSKKFTCECGSVCSYVYKIKHEQTMKHLAYLKAHDELHIIETLKQPL
jgi:hypothetical protein